jgi:S-(hydroxymethyl)glutathione dehydrogenase/alcohol dehydrogenase
MRGIVYDGESTRLVDSLEVRPPGPGEVAVRIAAAGLCHSDLSYMQGLYPVPHPAVCGHEAAGVVEDIGQGVTNVSPGDHVVITTLASCGVCEFCGNGTPTLCRSTLANWSKPFTLDGEGIFNFAATSAFAERTVVRDVQCVAIPDDVPLTSAALIGCGVVTGMGAVMRRANVQRGQAAVVFGVGGVGLNVLQALRVVGADPIVAVDTVAEKAELAAHFGATHFINGTDDDVVAQVGALRPASDNAVRGAFNAGGMDWAFDCVAHPQVTFNALECLDWGGSVVIIGVAAQDAEFHGLYGRLTQVDRAVMGCRYGTISPHRDIPEIVELYRKGLVDLDGLVSSTHPVEDWEQAVAELHSGAVARGVLTF